MSAGAARAWEPDHVITVDQARAAIRDQFPDVDADDLRLLGSGWEFDAYATGDGWVFRFPRKVGGTEICAWEMRVQDLVADRLAPVAVPRTTLFGEPTAAFPHPFTGHRMIPGIDADRHPDPPVSRLGAQLGEALTAIHSVEVEEATAAGAPSATEGPADWHAETLEMAPALRGIDPVVDTALGWLERVEVHPPYTEPPRFIHNDLAPEHVIVDQDTGLLVGIIDWTDAALEDPALDFVVLHCWLGWPLIDAILASYALPLDVRFHTRLDFLARTFSLEWLWQAIEQKGDVEKHIRWVHEAHRGRELWAGP